MWLKPWLVGSSVDGGWRHEQLNSLRLAEMCQRSSCSYHSRQVLLLSFLVLLLSVPPSSPSLPPPPPHPNPDVSRFVRFFLQKLQGPGAISASLRDQWSSSCWLDWSVGCNCSAHQQQKDNSIKGFDACHKQWNKGRKSRLIEDVQLDSDCTGVMGWLLRMLLFQLIVDFKAVLFFLGETLTVVSRGLTVSHRMPTDISKRSEYRGKRRKRTVC